MPVATRNYITSSMCLESFPGWAKATGFLELRGFCVNLLRKLRKVNVFIGTIPRFARYQSGSKLGTG